MLGSADNPTPKRSADLEDRSLPALRHLQHPPLADPQSFIAHDSGMEPRAALHNILDRDPPRSATTFANSFDPQMEIPGRFMYMRYTQNF